MRTAPIRRAVRGRAGLAAAGLLVAACSGTAAEVTEPFPGRTDWAGTMHAFDPATGEESWATSVPVPHRSGDRLVIDSVGDTLVFPTSEPVGATAVDAGTGEPVWQVVADRNWVSDWQIDPSPDAVTAVMVVNDTWVDPSPRDPRIMRIDLSDGTVVSDDPYQQPVGGPPFDAVVFGFPAVALIDTVGSLDIWTVCTPNDDLGSVSCEDGFIEAIDTTDVGEGDPSYFTEEPLWRLPIDRPHVSLADTPGTVYLAQSTGNLECCLRRWGNETWGDAQSGDHTGEEHLMAVDVTTGTVQWTAEFPNARLHAAVIDDTLYVTSVVDQTQYD